jgi:hypothetical protein
MQSLKKKYYKQVSREEGVRSLWNGATPTMGRAMAMNVGQLASYDVLKSEYIGIRSIH